MADLTYKDWGRIYAYVFSEKENQKEYEEYKNLLETDPLQGVTKIIADLNDKYKENQISFKPHVDAICDVGEPPLELAGNIQAIEDYRDGKRPATLRLRLVC